MTSILKELWHGNIVPCSDSKSAAQEMQDLSEYICRHRESLLKTLSDEQKEIFEKLEDCQKEYLHLTEEAIFQYSFKLGMRLAFEVLRG